MNMIQALLTLLSSSTYNCYQQDDVIDIHNNATLKHIAHDVAKYEKISIAEAESYFQCIPSMGYTKKRSNSKKQVKSPLSNFRKNLVSDYRIKQGVKFYKKHEKILLETSLEYNVDPFVITAIIGAESNYGRFTGKYNVKNALINIATHSEPEDTISVGFNQQHHPSIVKQSKQSFFVDEIIALIHLHRSFGLNLTNLTGSWDGGIGLPQFMPTSYQKYAVSKKNAFPDLFDPEDAIQSTANYLEKRGQWQLGPIAEQLSDKSTENLEFTEDIAHIDHTTVRRFMMNNGTYEYWKIFPNFNALLTYNSRPHYALCIHTLAEKIHEHTIQSST